MERLDIIEIDGMEFAVSDSEINRYLATYETIEQLVWAFKPSFLVEHIPHDPIDRKDLIDSIVKIQEQCEGANPILLAAIKDFKKFVDDAAAIDGVGHFLSPYDGEERDMADMEWEYGLTDLISVLEEENINTSNPEEIKFYRQ